MISTSLRNISPVKYLGDTFLTPSSRLGLATPSSVWDSMTGQMPRPLTTSRVSSTTFSSAGGKVYTSGWWVRCDRKWFKMADFTASTPWSRKKEWVIHYSGQFSCEKGHSIGGLGKSFSLSLPLFSWEIGYSIGGLGKSFSLSLSLSLSLNYYLFSGQFSWEIGHSIGRLGKVLQVFCSMDKLRQSLLLF